MAAKEKFTATIEIRQFKQGTQGQHALIELVVRTVHVIRAYWPEYDFCAAKPLREREYRWVSYRGLRWPVQRNSNQGDGQTAASHVLMLPPEATLNKLLEQERARRDALKHINTLQGTPQASFEYARDLTAEG